MLHSRVRGVRRSGFRDHAGKRGPYMRRNVKLHARDVGDCGHAPAVALAALVAFAAPAFVGPAASVVLDELTVPSSAPQVMAPPASLEQLPKVSPPVEAVRQAPAQTSTGQDSDNATPGEPAAPPPSKRRLSRLQELQQARDDLRVKQQELLRKTEELKEKEQTIAILQEELDIERVLRALLEKDKDKAEEIAKLATGLCSGAMMPP